MDEKYLKWLKTYSAYKKLEAEELKLRKEICYDILQNRTPPITIIKLSDNNKWRLKTRQSVRYNIDEPVFTVIKDSLSIQEKRAIKHKPTLKLKEYKQLPEDSLLHQAIIEKPTTPELKITEVKK